MIPPTISIAMTTYNGARWIAEQLESLDRQTLPPAEIMIGDDRSSDDVVARIRDFAAQSRIRTEVTVNPVNLGFGRNFAQTLQRCSGDYIFFCDQDDWWLEEKLETCSAALGTCAVPSIVTHDAWLADGELKSSGLTLCQQFAASGTPNPEDQTYGCCIGFHAFFKRFFAQDHRHSHDTWLFEIGRLLDARIHLAAPLILYRRHGANATASHATSLRRASAWQRWRTRFAHVLQSDIRKEVAYQIEFVGDLVRSFRGNAAAIVVAFGQQRLDSALATLDARFERLRARAEVLDSPKLMRIWRVAQLSRGGGYVEGSSLGMIRDIFA